MKNLTYILIILLSFVACSQEQAGDSVSDKTEQVNTGNKFKDAAINKVKMANPGLSVEKAQCVVEKMTAGGVFGLGEINQMKLGADAAGQNSSQLFQAYQGAVKACK
jgi:PBP1b-binding outer membrane lipoprotein LpoB